MIKNYLKLAIKVLGRKKFFTFISLFGISLTLMFLMVMFSFLDSQLGDNPPFTEREKMVFLTDLRKRLMVPDTSYIIDSAMVNGEMQYDSTMDISERQTSSSNSQVSYYILDQHLRNVDGVEKYTFFSNPQGYNLFLNGVKVEFQGVFTDGYYWDVFDFDLHSGRYYTEDEVERTANVAVMNTESAEAYFGSIEAALNNEVEIDQRTYTVVGIINKVESEIPFVNADVMVPHTHMAERNKGDEIGLLGEMFGVFVAANKANRKRIIDDMARIAENFVMPQPERYNELRIRGTTFLHAYAGYTIDIGTPRESYRILFAATTTLLSLFLLLPILNLININVSRILERASEIGVRKSFGANNRDILNQFIFENIILTIIGGVVGFILAVVALALLNNSGIYDNLVLRFKPKIFLASVILILVFGVLSGVVPAWKMSRLSIVSSLKKSAK